MVRNRWVDDELTDNSTRHPCHPPCPKSTSATAPLHARGFSVIFTVDQNTFAKSLHAHTMLLPTLIDIRRPEGKDLDPEDIFGSSLGGVFTDDLQNQHGDDPDTVIVYKNARHGNLEFRTADINGEEERRKMAHYLWNAGVLMAELVGGRPDEGQAVPIDVFGNEGWKNGEWWISKEEEKAWSVEGQSVIELGAGALG